MKNSQRKIKILDHDQAGTTGIYRIIKTRAGTKDVISVSPWIKNKIMKSVGYGVNNIVREMAGDITRPATTLEITSAQIGTGTNAPADTDTALQTPIVVGILRANQSTGVNTATLDFYIPDAQLPNGTYKEFALCIGPLASPVLFARSLISPTYSKASLEDTTVEYVLTVNNT